MQTGNARLNTFYPVVLSALAIAAAAFLPIRGTSAQADDPPDAFVVNSGSTNTFGYSIDVPRTGDASYTQGDQTGHGPIPAEVVKKFYADIDAASPLANLPRGHCMRSASFGTRTRITVGNDQSPDVDCAGNDLAAALRDDAKAIAAALGIKNQPRHPMPPPN